MLRALTCVGHRKHTHKTWNLSQGWGTGDVLGAPGDVLGLVREEFVI